MEELERGTYEKVCPNCGTVNPGDAMFCENCGTSLKDAKMQSGLNAGYLQNPENNGCRQNSAGYYSGTGDPNNGYAFGSAGVWNQAVQTKPIPKWIPILILEIAALAFCIYGITKTFQESKSPERVAENYFVHMSNGDWEKGYSELDVEDSDFINAEKFAEVCTQAEMGIVTNYQLDLQYDGKSSSGLSREWYDLAESLGMGGYSGQEEGLSTLEKIIKVDYREKGDTQNSSYLIELNQTPEGWKVGAAGLICKDYRIFVPIGADVSVDGVSLGEGYRLSEEEEEMYGGTYLDGYSIPQIFYGSHEIKITMEDMEEVSEYIEIAYGSSQYVQESMRLKEESLDALIQKAGENMQQIYSAAVVGKSFKTIENLFASGEEQRKEIEASYENLLTSINEEEIQLEKIAFQSISGKADTSGSVVKVSFDYDMDYRYKDWWSGRWESENYKGSEIWWFQFAKEDGNWVQINLGCDALY